MLRGLAVTACFVSACAAQPAAEPQAPRPAPEPDLALSALVTSEPLQRAARTRGPRRIGRLSPPFSPAPPARNVLARAPLDGTGRDLAAR